MPDFRAALPSSAGQTQPQGQTPEPSTRATNLRGQVSNVLKSARPIPRRAPEFSGSDPTAGSDP